MSTLEVPEDLKTDFDTQLQPMCNYQLFLDNDVDSEPLTSAPSSNDNQANL
jgi:hypothetical protein